MHNSGVSTSLFQKTPIKNQNVMRHNRAQGKKENQEVSFEEQTILS
jgi:hypothetical protein